MKRALLPACMLPLLSGCWMHHHEMDYFFHEIKITLKDGAPCFSPVSDDQLRKEQAGIYSATIIKHIPNELFKTIWGVGWNNGIFLSAEECIPYGGNTPLEKNTLYSLDLGVYVPGQKPTETHGYSTAFCLLEGKNGETIIWQTERDEHPTSCSPPENVPVAKPGDNKSQPQNANSPKEE
jgi:hypothetical protein